MSPNTSNSESTKNFFKDIEPLLQFEDAFNTQNHADLPDDWHIIITDILGSTNAIESGKYKQVNAIGACTIIAVRNVDRSIDVPFVFGGDGATLAIPPEMLIGCKKALLGAKDLARNGFGLELRAGIVPVSYLRERDQWVRLTKHRVSEHLVQAAITGHGWEYAENLVKSSVSSEEFEVFETDDLTAEADFSGFECRWEAIESRKDHKICILALSMNRTASDKVEDYKDIIQEITSVYGSTEEHQPLHMKNLSLSFNPLVLAGEAMVRSPGSMLATVIYVMKMLIQNIIVTIFFTKKINTKDVNWSNYQSDLIKNSDYKKFDGTLKMVLDGSKEQERRIRGYFESRYQKKELVYGIHTAEHAILTCMIISHEKDHVHFVDASDGGYAIAAKHLKGRLAAIEANRTTE